MERVAVIRDNGVIVNCIVFGDETAQQLLADGVTDFDEVTGLNPLPGIGWTWTKKDGYRPPKPFASWTWVSNTWVPPVAPPSDDQQYNWDEETLSWVVIEPPAAI